MALTVKQEKFCNAYRELNDATKAAIVSGYAPKSAHVEANRMLKNPKIIHELATWRAQKQAEISKTDFITLAKNDYDQLEVTEPNRVRNLDLIGKALKYTTAEPAPTTTNNTLNILNINALLPAQLHDSVRKMIASQ